MRVEKIEKQIHGADSVSLPKMLRIRQKFACHSIDAPAELAAQLQELDEDIVSALRNKRIGITAGSRGIPQYKELLLTLVTQLRAWEAKPFVFPAMGSHAGGTAESQREFLAGYGVTEEYLGVPILSSMEVVQVGALTDGMPVYCDKHAHEADGIILFHKVKPHTHFKGEHESGLLKMICIGVGKHLGAATFHKKDFADFPKYLVEVSREFMKNVPVFFGVGLVQNAFDLIGGLRVIKPEDIIEEDAALLRQAKRDMARLMVGNIDVLIIDEIGKDISGTGCDPNVIGRVEVESQKELFRAIAPEIKKVVILDLSKQTHGNALGMGTADIVTYRLASKVDLKNTYVNTITSNYLNSGALPVYGNSDLETIKIALLTGQGTDLQNPRIVRIKNTLLLDEIEVSSAYLDTLAGRDDIEILTEPYDWAFDGEGNLF